MTAAKSTRINRRGAALERLVLIAGLLLAGRAEAAEPRMVAVPGEAITALRLVDVPQRTVLLGRDGVLHDSMRESWRQRGGRQLREVEGPFQPFSPLEFRGRLQEEFGVGYEVVATQHYLVVQPRGRGRRWPACFERMYRQFVSYMERRGVVTRQGRFPLVAVIYPDEASMRVAIEKLGLQMGRVAGLYDLASNRVLLHDQLRAEETAATVRHEAAHQTAYNVGVHSRVSPTPRWLLEGVGSLFEPASMEQVRRGTLADRVPAGRLDEVASLDQDALAAEVRQLVTGDVHFQDPDRVRTAYAVSWAMTFFLAERQPARFAAYLRQTQQLPPFEAYPGGRRVADFERLLDTDIARFAHRLERFLAAL